MSGESGGIISGSVQCATAITSNETECTHQRKIDDEHTADEICIDCGLVLGRIFTSTSSPHEVLKKAIDGEIYKFIEDVCHNGCYSLNIIDFAFKKFKKLKEKLKNIKKKINNRTLAAFAIYEVMEKLEIPRTFEEIGAITGIPVRKIWDVSSLSIKTSTKEENANQKPSDPIDYVERYCTILNIDYWERKIIRNIVGNMFGFGSYKPSSLVAAVIRLYCIEKGKKLPLKTIADVCGICPANVHRIMRQLDSKYRKKITLLYS